MTTKDVSTCSVEGCEKPRKAHSLCNAHNEQRRLGKPLTTKLRSYEYGGVCKVNGCETRRTDSAEYCLRHRMRVRNHGDAGPAELLRSPAGQAVWHTRAYRRRADRLRIYGLTVEDFDALLERQGGKCGVCGSKDPTSARYGTWTVDHDHVTGQVRGLLCNTCNRAIGMLKDDPKIMRRAAGYISAHRQMILFGPAGPKGYAG